jgi:hypothetical protein
MASSISTATSPAGRFASTRPKANRPIRATAATVINRIMPGVVVGPARKAGQARAAMATAKPTAITIISRSNPRPLRAFGDVSATAVMRPRDESVS